MGKISHLQKVLLVMLTVLAFAIKNEYWYYNIFIVLSMYYLLFIANLFVRVHTSDNALTKIFFGLNETPMILGIVTIIAIIFFLRKQYPGTDFDRGYLCAVLGGTATTISRFKRGKLQKQSS